MRRIIIVALAAMAATGTCRAAGGGSSAAGMNSILAGVRYHMDHSVFEDLPFGNGDISYALGYEYSEGIAAWRAAVDYGPDISGKRGTATNAPGVDYVVTPQMHLLFTDMYLRGGGGILISYLRDHEGEGEWTNPYGQLQLGFHYPPSGRLALDLCAYYVFERFSDFGEFKFEDIEYGAWLAFKF